MISEHRLSEILMNASDALSLTYAYLDEPITSEEALSPNGLLFLLCMLSDYHLAHDLNKNLPYELIADPSALMGYRVSLASDKDETLASECLFYIIDALLLLSNQAKVPIEASKLLQHLLRIDARTDLLREVSPHLTYIKENLKVNAHESTH